MTEHTTLVSALIENGPCTHDALPSITCEAKASGVVSRFSVPSGTTGNGETTLTLGDTSTIYYSPENHTKKEVLQAWVDENKRAVDGNKNQHVHRQLCMNHPSAWKPVSRDVLGPFDTEAGGDQSADFRDCPFCEERFDGDFPGHLPCEEA